MGGFCGGGSIDGAVAGAALGLAGAGVAFAGLAVTSFYLEESSDIFPGAIGMAVASGFGVSLCGSACAGPSLAVVDGAGIAGAVCCPSFAALFCAHGPLDRTGSGSVADGAGGAGTDGVFDGASLGVAARVELQARRGGSAGW